MTPYIVVALFLLLLALVVAVTEPRRLFNAIGTLLLLAVLLGALVYGAMAGPL